MRRNDGNDYRCILSGWIAWTLILSLFASTLFAQEIVTVSGLTEPVKDVILSSEVGGRIAKIYFQEGDPISKGSTILALNKVFEELEVERRKVIWESKAEVNSASERTKTLKSILDTTRTLFETMGSVSKEELEERELEFKLAVAEHERLQIAEERERIEYEMALENHDKMVLKAPFQGIVTELLLDEGETCEQRQPLVHVVDTSKCRLVCNMDAPLGQRLKKGQRVDLDIPVGNGTIQKKGKIIFVSPVVDPASGLLTVKVEFENRDGAVRPGVAGTMKIPIQ